MKNASMQVVRLSEGDVIATSGIYLISGLYDGTRYNARIQDMQTGKVVEVPGKAVSGKGSATQVINGLGDVFGFTGVSKTSLIKNGNDTLLFRIAFGDDTDMDYGDNGTSNSTMAMKWNGFYTWDGTAFIKNIQ